MKSTAPNRTPMHRVNTRIYPEQAQFIKSESKRLEGEFREADIHRELLELGIEVYKKKNKIK